MLTSLIPAPSRVLAAPPREPRPVDVVPGRRFALRVGFSECAVHIRAAGQVMLAELLAPPGRTAMVQLYRLGDGQPYSAPVTPGEAGVYCNGPILLDGRERAGDRGYYCYAPAISLLRPLPGFDAAGQPVPVHARLGNRADVVAVDGDVLVARVGTAATIRVPISAEGEVFDWTAD